MRTTFIRDLSRRSAAMPTRSTIPVCSTSAKERGADEEPDRITPRLSVDDKVFKSILQSLYFEHGSPYDFSIMPVEILGTVYERFLGKVIHLTGGHRAQGRGKARSPQGGRRLLHAGLHRQLHRRAHRRPPDPRAKPDATGRPAERKAAVPRSGYGVRVGVFPAGGLPVPARVIASTGTSKTIPTGTRKPSTGTPGAVNGG